jgi:hypothetical protein
MELFCLNRSPIVFGAFTGRYLQVVGFDNALSSSNFTRSSLLREEILVGRMPAVSVKWRLEETPQARQQFQGLEGFDDDVVGAGVERVR